MKVAVYVRVSSLHQAQTQTIEQQLELIKAYFQSHLWLWDEENVFRDDGFSGASLKRPGLDRLRDKVALATFDQLLITAPDRLARKYVHQMLLIEEFEKAGCQIEFVERPMSQDPHDQLLLQIRGAVAEYERTLITERMRRGRQQRYRSGQLLPWTISPYGYRSKPDRPRDPNGVYLEPSEAVTVGEIFDYYLQENHTLGDLSRHLMELGIAAPKGKGRWGFMSLHAILTNPVYTGNVYAGRMRSVPTRKRMSPLRPIGKHRQSIEFNPPEEWILVGQVPGIVSKEQFELVQHKLAQNQKFSRRNNKSHQYLLRAMVSCGLCGNSALGCTRGQRSYYACRAKGRAVITNIEEKCRSRYLPADQLDEIVWADVCEVIQKPELIKQALSRAQGGEWLPQELAARRENIRKAKANLVRQIERLTEAYLAGVVELEEYKRRRQEVEQRQEGLDQQSRQLEASIGKQIELAGIANSIEEFCKRISSGLLHSDFEQKRRLVELLIDRVVVRNEEVEIRYVVPTSARSENIHFYQLLTDYFRPVLSYATRSYRWRNPPITGKLTTFPLKGEMLLNVNKKGRVTTITFAY